MKLKENKPEEGEGEDKSYKLAFCNVCGRTFMITDGDYAVYKEHIEEHFK